ncbi:hypothetical protein GH714_040044 [Hevea brasiliensis]|uniref:J domain-containing protein n=1 Tax=Hevea brasiliensis TaxID=3981 RepID=A0A6A6MNZ9_HEVBR|nr:hypothetical protein GH714_040044 [Hevea brasiliensis]
MIFLVYYIKNMSREIQVFDPYSILELEPGASESEIKKRYRRLSILYHPDKNPDPEAHKYFVESITKAYQALTDPISRENYEKYGHPDGRTAKVMEVFTKAAEYMEIPVRRTDDEPLQKLFVSVRKLLIQAQLARESAALSPALLGDFRRVLELAPRLLEELMKEGIPPFSYFLVVSGRLFLHIEVVLLAPFNESDFFLSSTIGRSRKHPNTQTPTPPTTHRPITRSVSRDHNSLVSEPAVMGDSVQDQLAKLFNLLLAEQQSNKELHAKFDALTQEWESTKKDFQTSSTGSPASLRRDKGISGTANSEKSGGSSFVPKFTKLDFPRYDGKDDPLGWLNRCKHFFQHQQTPEEEMVSLASYHLEGIAQLWYMQLLDDIPNPSWAEFSHQCNLRFGPPIRSNKLGELAKLKQMGSVADYQNQFEALVSRAGTLTQHQKVQLYLSGLQDSIAVEVELHHPTDLVNAMSISRLYERKLFPRSSAARDTRRAAIPPDNRRQSDSEAAVP